MTGNITLESLADPHVARFAETTCCVQCGKELTLGKYETFPTYRSELASFADGTNVVTTKTITHYQHVDCNARNRPTLAQTLERFLTHLCRGK
jgi:hypothetical protein